MKRINKEAALEELREIYHNSHGKDRKKIYIYLRRYESGELSRDGLVRIVEQFTDLRANPLTFTRLQP